MTFEEDLEKWELEKPRYIELEKHIKLFLRDIFDEHGLPVTIETRLKEDCSLIKKLIQKQHEESDYTYEKMTDKCGARIICRFKEDEIEACKIIDEYFIGKTEDHSNNLAYNVQGYKSIHKDVKFKRGKIDEETFEKFKNFGVEIQIRTLCENVWADIYHDIGYKPENIVDPKIKRQLHCLGGLLEIADNDFSKINDAVKNSSELTPEFILHCLEKKYIQLFRVRYDPSYSIENLKFLRSLLDFDTPDTFKKSIDAFIKKYETKIAYIRKERANILVMNPLATQPEVLLIFYLIETYPYLLKDQWEKQFSKIYLDELSTWWGTSIIE
jgi:ppGpp synthetase/RelA/SpoT-type nucleotidyltranferase